MDGGTIMSHFSNDAIVDGVICDVMNMGDFEVLQTLYNDYGVSSPINAESLNDDSWMDNKRNLLMDKLYEDYLGRPGPHG